MSKLTLNFSMSKTDISEISNYKAKVKNIHDKLHGDDKDNIGWVDYPERLSDELLDEINVTAKKIRKDSTALVVIGIGGSFLGARACTQMLLNQYHNEIDKFKIFFAGWNLSGTYHKELLDRLKKEEVSVCVVSKSGNTMETMATFSLFKKLLIEKYGNEFNKRIYTVTSKKSGTLRKETDENKYTSFVFDDNIGGRFSVLTPAGLLPIAAAGINIKKILAGAKEAYNRFNNPNIAENQCYQYGVIRRIINQRHNKSIEVFEFYEPRLDYFAEWLKQLFGESEGKEYRGIFPSSLILTRDLHSMGQFLQEGSQIFFESVFKVKNPPSDVSANFTATGLSFNENNNAVLVAVNKAHIKNNTPIITFELEDLSEETFGYAVYFYELACAVSSMLLGVNPFNQPGVEVYKKTLNDLIDPIFHSLK